MTDSHGPWASVRRAYGIPARRGVRVTYRGWPEPMSGRLTYCDGQYVWLRTDDGKKVGPLHPTSAMDYGDGRDYTAECNAIIAIRNDWINERITTEECRLRCAAVRREAIIAVRGRLAYVA
jgi:hypothetical protein